MTGSNSSTRQKVELVSTLGVVASLIFVGLEVRQNTAAIRATAIQEMSSQTIDYLSAWSTSPDVPGLLQRINVGALPADFTDEENTRLSIVFITAIRAYEARFLQVQLGVLDEEMFDSMAGAALIFDTPYFRERWGRWESSVGPDFAVFFRERFDLE